MKDPTQEEQKEAMENMECWKTQEHLKECRKCAPIGNWQTIEEEFRKKFQERHIWSDELPLLYDMKFEDIDRILAFFKPYFQEQMHDLSVSELEAVDNQKPL
jgi:hypothetical protein